MSLGLTITVIILLCASAFLKFVDYLRFDSERRRLRERLERWWFFVEDGDWSSITATAADATDGFINYFLGRSFFSMRYFLITFVISAFIEVVAFRVPPRLNYVTIATFFDLTLPGALIDTVALGLTRRVLHRLSSEKRPGFVVAWLVAVLSIAYAAAALSLAFIGVVGALFIFHIPLTRRHLLGMIESMLTWPAFAIAVSQETHVTRGWFILIAACLSSLLLFVFLLGAWLLSRSKRILQRPLSRMLDGFERDEKGVANAVAIALAAIASIVGTFALLFK